MSSELLDVFALKLTQVRLVRSWLRKRAHLCPQEGDPPLQPAAQILTSFPQPSAPRVLGDVRVPGEMPPYIILKQPAPPDRAQLFLPLPASSPGRDSPDWALVQDLPR